MKKYFEFSFSQKWSKNYSWFAFTRQKDCDTIFYGRYLWITSLGTIIHSPQKLWQGLDMKRIAIISAETRNSKKEVFFSWQSALKTFSLSLIMVVRDEFFAINKVWFLAGVLCTAHLLCCCPVALYNSRFGKMKTSSLFL